MLAYFPAHRCASANIGIVTAVVSNTTRLGVLFRNRVKEQNILSFAFGK